MLSISLDTREVSAALARLSGRDTNIAISWALNDTAKDVLDHFGSRMEVIFDRPTKFTKDALTISGASPQKLEAVVKERPSVGSRHFLKVQERGGPRPQTGLERLMKYRLAYEGSILSVLPAAGALLNSHGNWAVGERNRLLSSIQAQSDRMMNSTKVSKVKSKHAKQFFVPRPGSKLSPGVWKRTSRKAKLQKILHFSDSIPTYKPRFGFYDGAEEVFRDRLPGHLARTLEKMWLKRQG